MSTTMDESKRMMEVLRRNTSSTMDESNRTQTHDGMRSGVEEIVRLTTNNSEFFKDNPPRSLPTFKREEVEDGVVLGVGQFGVVREVKGIQKDQGKPLHRLLMSEKSIKKMDFNVDSSTQSMNHIEFEKAPRRSSMKATRRASVDSIPKSTSKASLSGYKEQSTRSKSIGFASSPEIAYIEPASTQVKGPGSIEARTAVQSRCSRGGKARFAVKRLRDELEGKKRLEGALDLAMEAAFLSSLTHPNIVRLRGFVGNRGDPDFMLILDRLYLTLADQISVWKTEASLGCGVFNFFKRRGGQDESFFDRLYAAYDIARAIKHLHELNLIHRDLKPENIAYDIRGDLRIYDFGLAREVQKEDLIRPPEDYNISGMTGSIRWMAPEVRCTLPYGPSADIYSFGLIFWNIFSLEVPYGKITTEKHFEKVVTLGKRPRKLKFLPSELSVMMNRCWSTNRSERPAAREICSIIQKKIIEIGGEDDSVKCNPLDRTDYLMDKSENST